VSDLYSATLSEKNQGELEMPWGCVEYYCR